MTAKFYLDLIGDLLPKIMLVIVLVLFCYKKINKETTRKCLLIVLVWLIINAVLRVNIK